MKSRYLFSLAVVFSLAIPALAVSPAINLLLSTALMGQVQEAQKEPEVKVLKELAIPGEHQEGVKESAEQYAGVHFNAEQTIKYYTEPIANRFTLLEAALDEVVADKEKAANQDFIKQYSGRVVRHLGLYDALQPAAGGVLESLSPVFKAEGVDLEEDKLTMSLMEDKLIIGFIQVDYDVDARKRQKEIIAEAQALKPDINKLLQEAMAANQGANGPVKIQLNTEITPENQKKLKALQAELNTLKPKLEPRNPRLRIAFQVALTVEKPKSELKTQAEAEAIRLVKEVKVSVVEVPALKLK